uniref:protein-disulfide reductase n=1 Tax=Kalanchoe fedtschenkoi TaxID=63787 RepID=A0A7N0RCG0_KALFE
MRLRFSKDDREEENMAQNELFHVLGDGGGAVLLRADGGQVKVSELEGKILGLYFASSSCEESLQCTPAVIQVYKELMLSNRMFEIIYVKARDCLKSLYAVGRSAHLVIFDEERNVSCSKGLEYVFKYGSRAFPFTQERVKEINEEREAAKANQTLRSILASPTRDFLVRNNGDQVAISDLEGKMVGLYFSLSSFRASSQFTTLLVELYREVGEIGENFEVVWVSMDKSCESFHESFKSMPWLAIPFGDDALKSLPQYFQLRAIPSLVIIGADGKTVNLNVCNFVSRFGAKAYPFSPEKLTELEEVVKAQSKSQTLSSLLVCDELDWVLGKNGTKVSASELEGRTVLFYFSRITCSPCRMFTPELAKIYQEIKAEHSDQFEVIFVSMDNTNDDFQNYYSEMPWLALPYSDTREVTLKYTLMKKPSIPQLVAVGPSGQTLTYDGRELITFLGKDAYPFDETRNNLMEWRLEEMAKNWPEKVRHGLHPAHDLVRERQGLYKCNGCSDVTLGWVFKCDECGFSLHPKCALGQLADDGVTKKTYPQDQDEN